MEERATAADDDDEGEMRVAVVEGDVKAAGSPTGGAGKEQDAEENDDDKTE